MTQRKPHATPDVGSAHRVTQPTNGRRRERLLIIGAGMASLKLVEELVERCPDRYEIVVAAKEPRPPYNRVLLSSLLAGEAEEADIELRPPSWFAEKGVTLLTGAEVSALRPDRQGVVLADGTQHGYDRLVLATGSSAVRLPVGGHTLPGVLTFRDLDDVTALQLVGPGSRVVVIGGGLLGVEAACGLAKRGVVATLVHIMPRLMERQLDARAAALLKTAIESKGIEVVLGGETAAIEGNGSAERVALKDGRAFPADLVVMAAGVRPETALAKSGELEVGRGVKVDDKLETSRPGVYAIGECAEHRGLCYGVVEPVYEQARALARHLAGLPARYEGSITAVSLKVSGVPVFSMGDFEGEGAEAIVLEDEEAGSYRKLVIRSNRLAGAVLFGDTADGLWYRDLMRQGTPIAPLRPALAFGKAYAEAA
jgi:nitrite reductase (NADH) large subunit